MKQAMKIGCGVFLGIMLVIVTMLACVAGIDTILLNNENNQVSELEVTPTCTLAVGWKMSTEVPYGGDGTPDQTLSVEQEAATAVSFRRELREIDKRQATVYAIAHATLEAEK